MTRIWVLTVSILFWPLSASANGAYTHVHMSQLAADSLPPGELRDLLAVPENRAALEAGSMFPDSGYAVDDPYGELAHWEPFLSSFIEQLRATHGGDYSSAEAQMQVAFLLGVASHGMADQSYDTTLLDRAFEVDGPENPDASVDQYADYFLVVDERVVFTVEPWAPYSELAPAMAGVGHTVSEGTLLNGVNRMVAVLGVQANERVARNLYWEAWASYPFLGTHVYNPDAVGSVPWVASLVTEYWAVLWDRLHTRDDADAQLVLRTVPEDGAVNWPVDLEDSRAWARPAIWFGYAIDRDQIGPLITLRSEATGLSVPFTIQTAYGGRERNLLFLRPDETLAHDAVHTVEIAAGVSTVDGRTSAAPQVFSFRTRCAPDRLSECPPLPEPLVTGPVPTRPDAGPRAPDAGVDAGPAIPDGGGGCSVVADGPSRVPGFWPFVMVGLLLTYKRRAR